MARRSSGSKKNRLLLSEVVERYLLDASVRVEKLTMVSYRFRLSVLVKLLTDLCQIKYLDEVNVDHLRKCTFHLMNSKVEPSFSGYRMPDNGSTLAISTVRGYVRAWKTFFSWCFSESLVDYNPADTRLKPPKPTKKVKPAFTEEHIYKMLSTFDTSDALGFRNYVILVLLLDTGMRLAELGNLRIQDVHENYVKVLGKGRQEREIGIYPETRKLLWKYISKYRVPANSDIEALFLTRSGTPLRTGGIKWIISQVQKKSGLEDIQLSAHVFRHTFAKMYLSSGGDVFKLSREMGHSDVQVTKLYLEDFSSSEARKDHKSYSPIARLDLKKQHGKPKK